MSLTPRPWKYGVRRDGSMWLSLGDPKAGPHRQGDLVATKEDADLIVAAPDLLDALKFFNIAGEDIVGATADHLIIRVPLKAITAAAVAVAKAEGGAS